MLLRYQLNDNYFFRNGQQNETDKNSSTTQKRNSFFFEKINKKIFFFLLKFSAFCSVCFFFFNFSYIFVGMKQWRVCMEVWIIVDLESWCLKKSLWSSSEFRSFSVCFWSWVYLKLIKLWRVGYEPYQDLSEWFLKNSLKFEVLSH